MSYNSYYLRSYTMDRPMYLTHIRDKSLMCVCMKTTAHVRREIIDLAFIFINQQLNM